MDRLVIGGHRFIQFRIEGNEVWPTVARVLREVNPEQAYLRKEGGNVITRLTLPVRAKDVAELEHDGVAYILIVEERDTALPPG